MSLVLDGDPKTTPGVEVKTHGFPENLSGRVEIWSPNGRITIGYSDFLAMTHYVLTNTDLQRDDPRLAFIEAIKNMKKVPGFNGPPSERLDGPYPKM